MALVLRDEIALFCTEAEFDPSIGGDHVSKGIREFRKWFLQVYRQDQLYGEEVFAFAVPVNGTLSTIYVPYSALPMDDIPQFLLGKNDISICLSNPKRVYSQLYLPLVTIYFSDTQERYKIKC